MGVESACHVGVWIGLKPIWASIEAWDKFNDPKKTKSELIWDLDDTVSPQVYFTLDKMAR
jgi:hypothetical protein